MNAQPFTISPTATLEEAVVDLVKQRGGLAPGEIVTHFDLVVSTLRFERGREIPERWHWSTVGADPHMSYGVLNAEATRILNHDLT
jgi:hypothetical protein